MTSTAEAKRAVQETIGQLGGIDIIIANAGWTRFADWKDLDAMSEEEWDKVCLFFSFFFFFFFSPSPSLSLFLLKFFSLPVR